MQIGIGRSKVEKSILDTIREFINQLEDIQTRKPGTQLSLRLAVSLPHRYGDENEAPSIQLEANFYDGSSHQTCKAASLDSLMEEVKRRLGFEDREQMRLQTLAESFKAIAAPKYNTSVEGDF